MTVETTYSHARAHFAELWDRTVNDREPVIVRRRGSEDIVFLPADELESLLETAYLLRSPANAKELLEAYGRAISGEGEVVTLEMLRREIDEG